VPPSVVPPRPACQCPTADLPLSFLLSPAPHRSHQFPPHPYPTSQPRLLTLARHPWSCLMVGGHYQPPSAANRHARDPFLLPRSPSTWTRLQGRPSLSAPRHRTTRAIKKATSATPHSLFSHTASLPLTEAPPPSTANTPSLFAHAVQKGHRRHPSLSFHPHGSPVTQAASSMGF
jgi:hypothetical protein